MPRLPVVGSDTGTWGGVLNEYLEVEHNSDGSHKTPGVPAGALMPYAGASAPTGWLLCYGQTVSRTTYADLFTAISTSYGAGDGSTTFNVPDMRGRFPLGKDNMGGTSANRVTATQADNLGQASGAETHTLITAEIPSHSHVYQINSNGGGQPIRAANYSGAIVGSASTDATGGGGEHNNMSPYLTFTYIIKT